MSARAPRKPTLLAWLRLQKVACPKWWLTPERVVRAFACSGPGREATTGEATVALDILTKEGHVRRVRFRPSGREWFTWSSKPHESA